VPLQPASVSINLGSGPLSFFSVEPNGGNFTAVISLPVFHSVTLGENGNGYYPGNDRLSSSKSRLFGNIKPGLLGQVKSHFGKQ
jgi:hypothetical protein